MEPSTISPETQSPLIIEEDTIQLIMRQTNYNYDESKTQLQLHTNDITKVIRLYLKNEGDKDKDKDIERKDRQNVDNKPLSMNQQIYKEIRDLMYEGEKN